MNQDEVDRRVRLYVYEVLKYGAAVERQERVVGGAAGVSPLWGQLRDASMYWLKYPGGKVFGLLGSGNWGTKGAMTGSKPEVDLRDSNVNPEIHGRYMALKGRVRRTTDAVIEDSAGFLQIAIKLAGEHRNPILLDLEHRLAMYHLASAQKRREWQSRIVSGDSPPALADSFAMWAEALREASAVWVAA